LHLTDDGHVFEIQTGWFVETLNQIGGIHAALISSVLSTHKQII
jgi:hypothetical protein